MEEKGKIILRVALAMVFLWFGLNQLFFPENWIGFVPEIIQNVAFNVFGITAVTFIYVNSFLEVVLGLFMFFGLYTRFSSLILGLHLLGISLSLGFSATGVRDFGLAFATLAVFFNKADNWCLDKILSRD